MTADCPHEREVLLGMNCGAGGVQYRKYCLTCWRAGHAMPHHKAFDLCREIPPPMADRELIDQARDAYHRQAHRTRGLF